MKLSTLLRLAAVFGFALSQSLSGSLAMAADKGVWTDAADPTLPVDFKIQGEYVGDVSGGGKLGAQVIALGGGTFQAVLHLGGLPGDGWDGKNKILLDGKLEGNKAAFAPVEGKKRYLAQTPAEFSATQKFPPTGQKNYTAISGGETFSGKTDDGHEFTLKKTVRSSPTMGAKAPDGSKVLFDGSDTKSWNGGRLDAKTKLLNTDGGDITTKDKFMNYTAHVEFMLPYRPEGRGQGRGNSGFYQVDHYEVQILDSFGLDGVNNECSGIYSKVAPTLNMCLPPLAWQTYDIEFTNAVRDEKENKKTADAVITVKLNGVVVHDKVKITGPTGGHRSEPEGTPGILKLQGHGNPLQFRNIWVAEKK